ncbi:MAG TPA: sugar phosphate isomerase/epimerase [Phycisphaerales bacterium]|nr:sugar phosphate isomerase/epimerase [Phycisphaerales bacterium]
MAQCGPWPIGVCSWSLQQNIPGVVEAMHKLDIDHVHLDVGPACEDDPDPYMDLVQQGDWTISSTMIGFAQEDYSTLETIKQTGGIVPDDCWDVNRQRFLKAIEVTAALGVNYLSSHFGFLDMSDPAYADKLIQRVRLLADAAAAHNVVLLMETGQERADELKAFLEKLNHPALGVNFDPANMILYNMGDPLKGVRTLAAWVKHVHIKDALRADQPGTWGQEVIWADGQVGAENFLKTLREINYTGVLAIERECGQDRFGDIKTAVERLKSFAAA